MTEEQLCKQKLSIAAPILENDCDSYTESLQWSEQRDMSGEVHVVFKGKEREHGNGLFSHSKQTAHKHSSAQSSLYSHFESLIRALLHLI